MLQGLLKREPPPTIEPGSQVHVYACSETSAALVACGGKDLSNLGAKEAAFAAGGAPIIVDARHPQAAGLIDAIAASRPETPVLALGEAFPAAAIRALLRLQASDIAEDGAAPEDLLARARGLEAREAGPGAAPVAQCWAVLGAVGGAGATTIAIEIAHALAERTSGKGVCLMDLNLSDGMTSAYLDGEPKLDLKSLCADPGRLDERLLAAWRWRHDAGFDVVTAPRDPEAERTASEDGVLSLLDLACASYPFVILDMPRHRLAWSQTVLGAVDQAVVVSELTVPSLHAAADVCRDIDQVRGAGDPARLVLNRLPPKKQMRGGFSLEQAESAIGRRIFATVSSDWFAAREAVNIGTPVAAAKAKSPLVADVRKLTDELANAQVARTGAAAR